MSIKSIIIDNKQTTAKRIAPDKVQLNLVAMSFDEQNDGEPHLSLRLFVNGDILKTLQTDPGGVVKESIIISNTDNEQIALKLEEYLSKVQSKIKYVLIQDLQEKEEKPLKVENTHKNLYNLHQKTIGEFKIIDIYFQELINPQNKHNEQFIASEFNKVPLLANIKYQLKIAKELEFYDEYKDRIEAKIAYCKNEMTIHEINVLLQEVQGIINEHNSNIVNFRNQRALVKQQADNETNRIQNEKEKREIKKLNEEKEDLEKKYKEIIDTLNRLDIINLTIKNMEDQLNILTREKELFDVLRRFVWQINNDIFVPNHFPHAHLPRTVDDFKFKRLKDAIYREKYIVSNPNYHPLVEKTINECFQRSMNAIKEGSNKYRISGGSEREFDSLYISPILEKLEPIFRERIKLYQEKRDFFKKFNINTDTLIQSGRADRTAPTQKLIDELVLKKK